MTDILGKEEGPAEEIEGLDEKTRIMGNQKPREGRVSRRTEWAIYTEVWGPKGIP